jgi:ABC-type glycerol-3-phosphate transport system substrate-binding protein
MSFPLGKPLLVMAVLACVGLGGIWLSRPGPATDMTIWLFANSHRQILCDGDPSLIEQYQQATGKSVGVDCIAIRGLDVRLVSIFFARSERQQLPDAAEIEIGSIGQFFRPPVKEVGFYPLNKLIASLPSSEQLLPSRLAPWTKDGVIFGVPHDVAPVAILYRKDLFEEAGVDLPTAKTWMQFQQLCLKAQAYWASHGHPNYHALELRRAGPDQLLMMLQQRHINPLDDQNRVHIADPTVARTLAFYAQLVAGAGAISAEPPAADVMWTRTLVSGQICAAFCPDWRIAELKAYAPKLAGKIALMPLPRFEPTDAPTATWGGTMIGIPRGAKNPQASWRMIRYLYLSPQALAARRKYTDILPPIPAAWSDLTYHQPDPYFGGQRISELYIHLARQLPERYVTPFTILAEQQLANVMTEAIAQMRNHGSAGLEKDCQHWLNIAAVDLQRRVDFGKFDNRE